MKHHCRLTAKDTFPVGLVMLALVVTFAPTERSTAQSLPFGGFGEGETVEGDPFFGDWAGHWIDPKGEKILSNPMIVAQVVPRGHDRYQINILSEFDKRCVPYAVVEAEVKDGRIEFDNGTFAGTITSDRFTGSGFVREYPGKFEMEKVTRLSPNLGLKPPTGAIVLFDGTNFDQWEPSGRLP